MGMLENIQSGKENKPPRIMIYGSEGIGKSSYAAGAPNAIFIQTEDGLGEIDCRKFPLAHSLSEVIAELTALRDEAHEFQTVVVDSVDSSASSSTRSAANSVSVPSKKPTAATAGDIPMR